MNVDVKSLQTPVTWKWNKLELQLLASLQRRNWVQNNGVSGKKTTTELSATQLSIQTVKTQTNLAQTASSLRYFKPKLFVLDYGGVNNFQLMALINQQLFSTN